MIVMVSLVSRVIGVCYFGQPAVDCGKILGGNPDPYFSLPLHDVPTPLSCLYIRDRVFTTLPNMAFINATSSLKIIQLCETQVTSVDNGTFYGLSVTHLLLSHNLFNNTPVLTGIEHTLQVLDLSYNQIQTMSACDLVRLRSLTYLGLKYNGLTTLADPSYLGFSVDAIVTVDVYRNSVATILSCTSTNSPMTTKLRLMMRNNGELPNLDAIADSVWDMDLDGDLPINESNACAFAKLTRLETLSMSYKGDVSNIFPDLRIYGQGIRVKNLRLRHSGFSTLNGTLMVTECNDIPVDPFNRTFNWEAGTEVYLAHNELSLLPDLSLMADAVTELNLDFNNIQTLPNCGLKKLTNLKTLSLRYNKISVFPDAAVFGIDRGGSNLVNYCPDGERLQPVEIRHVPLSELYLDSNNLQDMLECDFVGFEYTKVINLRYNNLMRVADPQYIGQKSMDMVSLVLDRNALVKVLVCETESNSNEHIRSKMKISVSRDKNVTAFPHFGWVSATVTELLLTNNDMTDMDACSLLQFPQLTSLNMAYSSMSSAPDVSVLYQNGTWKVTYLNFRSTGFRNFSRCPNATEEIVCPTFPNTSLVLSKNTLDHVPNLTQISQAIVNLDLSYNNLVALDSCEFQSFSNLVVLNLDNNQLTIFPDASIFGYITSNLLTLKLNGNKMGDISADAFCGFDNLLILEMKSGNLTRIPELTLLQQLTELHLDYNAISDPNITVGDSSMLQTLSLIGNKLKTFPKPNQPLTYLTSLKLKNNEIQEINDTQFLCWLDKVEFSSNHNVHWIDFFGFCSSLVQVCRSMETRTIFLR